MTTSEREMVQPLGNQEAGKPEERITSLQPTYEDSVPPDPDEACEDERWES